MNFLNSTKIYTQHSYTGYSFFELLIWKIATIRRFVSQERHTFSFRKLHKLFETWKLKNSFSGPALIAATGPSLLKIPIEILEHFRANNSLIAVNLYLLSSSGKKVPPNFQIIADKGPWEDFHSKNFNDFRTTAGSLVESDKISYVIQPYNLPDLFSGQKSIYIHKNPLTSIIGYKGILGPSGLPNYTTFFAISTALHLGFSPIYVTGLDLNFFLKLGTDSTSVLKLGNHHAYEEDERAQTWDNRNSVEEVLSASAFPMHYLKKFRKKEIFILGDGSMVDTIKKVSVADLKRLYSIN
jgi:hypothetical protein